MGFIKEIFEKDITKKLLVLLSLVVVVYAIKGLINVFLLTFVFTYLINSLQKFISNRLPRSLRINHVFLTVLLYLILGAIVTSFLYNYVPIIINQIRSIIYQISTFDVQGNSLVQQYLMPLFDEIDISSYSAHGMNYLIQLAANIGKGSINIFMALVLSMFFMIEKDKVKAFSYKFKNSRASSYFKYIQLFGANFLNSFGKVIQAQILIAFTNTVLSVIALSIMRFPQLLGLGVMIFTLSLIPVAGTFISLVPLSIIAFNKGGITYVVYVIVMIAALHALESYVLNPKFMSDKTKLPVFYTFMVLLISEHFMGIWGLLIGIPLFMFILDLLNVKITE